MLDYCPQCDKKTQVKIINRQETYPVKKEEISILVKVMVCCACGRDIFKEDLDSKNLERAFTVYRKKHSIIEPAQIADIRNKYELSQRGLAALLGWGDITICRYESGMIPDEAHNNMLVLINDPINMKRIFIRNKLNLPDKTRDKLEKTLSVLIKKEKVKYIDYNISSLLHYPKDDIFNGFRIFNLDKFNQLVAFILKDTGGVFKTKLNKLLWYCDFYNYKILEKSLTGSIYVHLDLGPVPDQYEYLLAQMIKEGLINIEEIPIDNKTGEFYSLKEDIKASFNLKEIKNIQHVLDYFRNYSGARLKDRSHEEEAFKKTAYREKIPYKWAHKLSI
jgi:putative zinc finger/helix-turn-helix YgiT family protein